MENQNTQTFNLTFDTDALNLVLGALSELPAKVSMGLIMNIQQQVQPQIQQVPKSAD